MTILNKQLRAESKGFYPKPVPPDSGGTKAEIPEKSSLNDGWTYLERRGEYEATNTRPLAVASVRLDAARFVTVVVTRTKKYKVVGRTKLYRRTKIYKVFLWKISHDGSIQLLDSAAGESATQVAIAALPNAIPMLGHPVFVTAARTDTGHLRVTAWDVDNLGGLTRKGSGETEEIHGEFAIISAPNLTFVTALSDSSDRLTLISWQLSSDGSIQPLKTMVVTERVREKVEKIALATYDSYPPPVFPIVTAGTTPANGLKLISWRVDAAGAFSRVGDLKVGRLKIGPVRDLAASYLSHRRIATAVRLGDKLEVWTWDFDAGGQILEHSKGAPVDVGHAHFGMTTLNASHVITAVADGGGRLTLMSWDAVDNVVRLGHARAEQADMISVVSLGSDWLATPMRTKAGTLKVIVWLEHGVSLLRGEWSGIPHEPPPPGNFTFRSGDYPIEEFKSEVPGEKDNEDDGAAESPEVSQVNVPGIEGHDAMVSVGFNYVIVSQDHSVGFFDKQMNYLGEVTSSQFFDTFLRGTKPDGSRNGHAINRHLGFEPGSALDKFAPGSMVYCDPDATGLRPVCFSGGDAFFDLHSYFDPVSGRFFIAAPARPGCKKVLPSGKCTYDEDQTVESTNVADNPLLRRYFAFAVSKTEDPRDGFYQWMTTEAGRTYDFPRIAVNNGMMIFTAAASAQALDIHPFGMKPKVFVLSVEDLIQGKPYPRSHKFLPTDFSIPVKTALIPLRQHGDTGNRTFLIRTSFEDRKVFVYSFKNPSDWTQFPGIDIAVPAYVGVQVKNPDDTGFFRDGKIYFTWHKDHPGIAGDNRVRRSIRLLRLPLLALATNPTPSTNASDGFFYHVFGIRTQTDGPQDVISYVMPDVVVNRGGHMVVPFARVGYNVSLFPEARYKIYYANESGPRRSRLLMAGGAMPSKTPDEYLDYQTSAIDPSDDRTVWMMSLFFAGPWWNQYRAVIGKLVP